MIIFFEDEIGEFVNALFEEYPSFAHWLDEHEGSKRMIF